MAQWGNTDDAANSVLWAVSQLNKTANTGNQDALFGNTTADAFVTGVTTGQFGIAEGEAQAARAGATAKGAHTGWVLRTVGSGGRAGRVQNEVLVAMNTITSDGEDIVTPDYIVRITSQPSNTTANTTAGEQATFTVAGATTPAGGTLTYQWTYANGAAIAAGANVGVATGATLTVNSGVQTTNAAFKVVVGVTGGVSATSANATLTITT